MGKVNEWYYGKWDQNGDDRVIVVSAVEGHSLKTNSLVFLDDGESADQALASKKFLPSSTTVNIAADPKAGDRTLRTFSANEPTPKSYGIFVSPDGRGSLLMGQVNSTTDTVKVWVRQPRR